MYLTAEQEKLLQEGTYAERKAMELIVALGEVYEAQSLIPITSAHIAGVSYKNIGDEGLEFLRRMADGTKVKVMTTANPMGIDEHRWREMPIAKDFVDKQMMIADAYRRMGVMETWTCTPYLVGNRPGRGEHIAWAESSAVVFANSILGARTNREGGPSSLASAITGWTPNYGMHLDENRKATMVVEVQGKLTKDDYALLGYETAEIESDGVPYFRNIKGDEDDMKNLGAALAAKGSVALFHVEGVTGEWRTALSERVEKIKVGRKELGEAKEKLTNSEEMDIVTIGCPHLSSQQLRRVAEILRGRKLRGRLWVFTSRNVWRESQDYVKEIESAGAKVFCDTCMIVSPIESAYASAATDSAKASIYFSSLCNRKSINLDLESLIRKLL